ncbi:DNA primase [Bacillus phage vB_BthS_BMBphi]|nr:DNA primase [Bacillus phage vB_BthS_BMBphi]
MTLVWVGNQRLDIDLIEELQAYHWERERWTEDKLTACSPFRYDKSPSFFVNLTDIGTLEIAGTWKDSGGGTSGNFVELLAHLQDTDYDSALEYLVDKYAPVAYEESRRLHPWKDTKEFKPLRHFSGENSDYLKSRGISDRTQCALDVSEENGKVIFPWKNPINDVMAIKYRNIDSKIFSYAEGGYRINQCLFGIQQVYRFKATTLWICEAEIDALTVWENGYASVALGGSSISDRQAEMILQSGVQRIVIASDNDKAGKDLAKKIKKKLYSLDIYEVKWNQEGDDINAYYLREDKLPPVSKCFNVERFRMRKLLS